MGLITCIRTQSGTFMDGDLLVNRDGVRIVSKTDEAAVRMKLPSDFLAFVWICLNCSCFKNVPSDFLTFVWICLDCRLAVVLKMLQILQGKKIVVSKNAHMDSYLVDCLLIELI